jgi:outer membrane receptor protein involved in Fe transport
VVRGLTLRGQYSTAFRVPYNSQLFTPQVEVLGRVGDPKFGGVTVRPMVLTGGNPALRNQTSTSWSSGGQVALFDRRLTLSVDYYRIDYNDLVFQPRLSEFILIEDLYPQYFQRAAPEAGQPAGVLQEVVNVPINAASFKTSGIDLQLGFRLPDTDLGSFNVNVQATEVLTRKRRLLPLTPETNLRRDALFGAPFSLRGTMDWSKGIVGAVVAVNYKSATTNPVFGATILEVGSLTTVDAQVRVRMDNVARGLKGLTLSIGATNLFDTPSPFLDSDYGIDFFKWDPRGRVAYLAIGKSF